MMGRFGCLLMFIGALALAVVIVLPVVLADNPSIDYLMERMLCNPGEIYSSEPNTSTSGGGLALNLSAFCVGDDNVRRDVTGTQTLYGLMGFGVPFLLGLLLFIVGVSRNAAEGRVVAVNVEALSSTRPAASVSPPQTSLSERLREIDEAYNNRLITRDEYEAARQQAIDDANY